MNVNESHNPFELLNSKLDLVLSTISKFEANLNKQETLPEDDFLDLNGAAQVLHMPSSSIHFHKKHNNLPYIKAGKRCLFIRKNLIEWVENYGRKNNESETKTTLKFKN